MKKLFAVMMFIAGSLFAVQGMAQIYDQKAEQIGSPMDRTAEQHAELYADVGKAGDAEEAMSQDERYGNMTEPLDEANERHFDEVTGYKTVQELPSGMAVK